MEIDDKLLGQIADGVLVRALRLIENEDFVGGKDQYDSPLEYAFAKCVDAMSRLQLRGDMLPYMPAFGLDDAYAFKWLSDHPYIAAAVFPQVRIGDYRVDFLFVMHAANSVAGIVVEIDGHDFHERTKEQAERDKSRDRELQRKGFKVFRFTGSEVWRDPFKCVQAVVEVVIDGNSTIATPEEMAEAEARP